MYRDRLYAMTVHVFVCATRRRSFDARRGATQGAARDTDRSEPGQNRVRTGQNRPSVRRPNVVEHSVESESVSQEQLRTQKTSMKRLFT